MRFLSRSDLERSIDMASAIEAARDAFRALSSGRAVVPQRSAIEIPERSAVSLFMPASMPGSGVLGCKVVSVHPGNLGLGLAAIQAIVILIDEATGRPVAILEGGFLTALRTGAASGAATDALARPDSRVLACFGAGPQAATQIEAVCEVRSIESVRILSRSGTSARVLAESLAGRGKIPRDTRAEADVGRALAEADILCTATPAKSPLFSGANLKPGTHINSVGSFTPEMREVDSETIRRALVVVDSRGPCLAEAGELILARAEGAVGGPETWTELGEILLGRAPGRTSDDQITYFKSVGNAIQDVATARVALLGADRLGLGSELAW